MDERKGGEGELGQICCWSAELLDGFGESAQQQQQQQQPKWFAPKLVPGITINEHVPTRS